MLGGCLQRSDQCTYVSAPGPRCTTHSHAKATVKEVGTTARVRGSRRDPGSASLSPQHRLRRRRHACAPRGARAHAGPPRPVGLAHCTESSTSSQTVNDAPDQDRTSGLIPTAAPGRSRRRCIRPPAAGGYISDAFARRDAVTNSRLPREPQKSSRHGGMPRASAVRPRRTAWACVAPPRNARATELDGHGVYRWENVDRLNPVTL